MRTPWGYEAEDLGPIITLNQFHAITDCAYMDNPRVESALLAASQAIRNYCGWHISPSVKVSSSGGVSGDPQLLRMAYQPVC